MPTVSVAMATYNGEQHLRRQLDTIAAQTHTPAELVVVDDGSTDGTLSVITTFAKNAPFPVHVHQNDSRLGYRGNFMRAASLCNSDLIAFSDQDDNWYPQKIATCVQRFDDPEVLLVYHNAHLVTPDGKELRRIDEFGAGQPLSSGLISYSFGFTQIFRRSLLQFSNLWPLSLDLLYPGQKAAHDKFYFLLASVFGKIAYIDEPLVGYVQHGTNTHGWRPEPHAMGQLRYLLVNHGYEYNHLSNYLEHCATILDAAQKTLNGAWRERAQVAANNYRKASQAYARRGAIYESTRFWDRLNSFRKLLTEGGYQGTLSFGLKSLVKDLCLGVSVGPFLKSPKDWRAS